MDFSLILQLPGANLYLIAYPVHRSLKKIFGCGNCKYGSDGRTIRLILFLLNFIVTVTLRLQL